MNNPFNKIKSNSFLAAIIYRYFASLFLQLTAFVVGMVVSKLLGPEMLGYWGLFHIVTNYYVFSNLGSTNGLTRELGLLIGKNERGLIKNNIGAASAIHIVFPGTASLILIVYSFFLVSPLSWVFLFSGIVSFVELYEETLIRITSAFERHKILARISVFRSLISFLIVIPLVYFFDLRGRIIAALILAIIGLLVTYRYLPVPLSLSFNKTHIINLISIGFPIALTGFFAASFFLVDRLVITKFLTIEDLGFFTFAFYLVTVIKNIKYNVASILYQRQNIIFGADGAKSKQRLFEVSKCSALFTTDLTGVLSGLILIVFSFFVKYFMPEYINSIAITYIIVFSQVMGSINVFNTVGKHRDYLIIMIISLIINIALSILFVKLWGIIGVAYATFLSFILLNIVINFSNLKYFDLTYIQNFKLILRIILVPLYCYVIARGIEYLLFKNITTHIGYDIVLMFILLTTYAVFMIPLFFMLKGHLRFLNRVTLVETTV
ncbi:MAG: hypothetical protein EHM93_15095 [Bacteroidales bacterium]|nr:MAG: hypothetical protein EHM93_15095 [Bacteroidales bacterium]